MSSLLNQWLCLSKQTQAVLLLLLSVGITAVGFYQLHEFDSIILLSFTFGVVALGLFCFLTFEQLLLLMVFLTPWSFPVVFFNSFELSILSEPLMLLLTVVFLFRIVHQESYPRKLLLHPITIAILFNLLWMLICIPFSSMPAVSFKYYIARLWFVLPSFFSLLTLFTNLSNIRLFYRTYGISLLCIILYTIVVVMVSGFSKRSIDYGSAPFYKDHTIYGAVLGIFLPICFYFAFDRSRSYRKRLLDLIGFVILGVGLLLSFTRAAWVSIAIAIVIYAIIRWRIKLRYLILAAISITGIVILFQNPIQDYLQKKRLESGFSLSKHVASIVNVTNDHSNLERVNRWSSAIRMGNERPVFGWGPRTYLFKYAPFQEFRQQTDQSSNVGARGTAHSEYLEPFAESGWVGMLSIIAVFSLTFYTAIKVYRQAADPSHAKMALFIGIGLLTYYVHAFLNNYLDTEKLSVPVWGFTAAIVAIDLFAPKKPNRISDPENN